MIISVTMTGILKIYLVGGNPLQNEATSNWKVFVSWWCYKFGLWKLNGCKTYVKLLISTVLATFVPDHLLLVNCLVPENIHIHPKEGIQGIGNSMRELSRAPIFIGKYKTKLGGAVAPWLACPSLERAVRVRALAGDTVLCSWARHLTLTVPLSTQVWPAMD